MGKIWSQGKEYNQNTVYEKMFMYVYTHIYICVHICIATYVCKALFLIRKCWAENHSLVSSLENYVKVHSEQNGKLSEADLTALDSWSQLLQVFTQTF